MTATAALAEPVSGEAILTRPEGYARLVIKLQSEVEAQVGLAGSILIIRFKEPVDVPVDKLAEASPDYVGSARIDPDGTAIRLALNRKVRPNVMAAGEQLFVDLLPESWTGMPPGLPIEVVKELVERARAAEQQLRQQRLAADAQKKRLMRVKASRQPTFARYVFDLSAGTNVSSILNSNQLVLSFTPGVAFDLADAQLVGSTNVTALSQKIGPDSTTVTFDLVGQVDVHAFREEKTYVVDIGFEPDTKPKTALSTSPEFAVAKITPPPADGTTQAKPADSHAVPGAAPGLAQPETGPASAKPSESAQPAPAAGGSEKAAIRTAANAVAAEAKMAGQPAESVAEKPKKAEDAVVAIQAKRSSAGLRLAIPFAASTAGAVFSRNDTVWLLFDGDRIFNLEQITKEASGLIREASTMALAGGQAIRLRLGRPQLPGLSTDGATWLVDLSDAPQVSMQPLAATRTITEAGRGVISIPMAASQLLKLADPEGGDTIMVVTAQPPAAGFAKRQNFVDFSLLQSAHGVAVQANADDLRIEVTADKVSLTRPGGLTLSAAEAAQESAIGPALLFDGSLWKANRETNFRKRLDALTLAAAMSSGDQRIASHLELARFYFANELYPEAKGVLDTVLTDAKPGPNDAATLVLHAVANIMRGDPDSGLAELGNPLIGGSHDSQLWKAVACARLGRWTEAREKFKGAEFAIGSLPRELQRAVIVDEVRAALEVRDYSGVSSLLNDLDVIGIPNDMRPAVALIRGRMAEALGKEKDALGEYTLAVKSDNREASSAARVNEIALRRKRNEITAEQALTALETLALTWRGDTTEVRTLDLLARSYADLGRYRDALMAARVATKVQANSDISRQLQDNAAALFTDIFLGQKGDDLPPVQALALFYEFSELTPIGRRGDELIRRLAERLAAIDLLDQASELLQYQIDERLEGAARAQVASRLAMIYLMNRKPDRAIAVLRSSRANDLAGELRTQRLLIEARAQSDIGRSDLALDIISNIQGREAIRLRSDVYWAARRWRESSEQIELMYGDRWRDQQPFSAEEKADLIRAAIGYAIAEDKIGVLRLREKYAAKMETAADKAAFDAATSAAAANSAESIAIAKMASSVDTLGGFIRDMKTRFPEIAAKAPSSNRASHADPLPTGSLPRIQGTRIAPGGRL